MSNELIKEELKTCIHLCNRIEDNLIKAEIALSRAHDEIAVIRELLKKGGN